MTTVIATRRAPRQSPSARLPRSGRGTRPAPSESHPSRIATVCRGAYALGMPRAFLIERLLQRGPQGRHGRGPASPKQDVGRIPPALRDGHPSVDLNDIVACRSSVARIRTLPRLSLSPAFPQSFTRETVNPDPLERRVLFPELEEVIQGLSSTSIDGSEKCRLVTRKSLHDSSSS